MSKYVTLNVTTTIKVLDSWVDQDGNLNFLWSEFPDGFLDQNTVILNALREASSRPIPVEVAARFRKHAETIYVHPSIINDEEWDDGKVQWTPRNDYIRVLRCHLDHLTAEAPF